MAVTGVTAWAREVPVAKPHVGVAVGQRWLHVDLARSIESRAKAVALQAAVCVAPEARSVRYGAVPRQLEVDPDVVEAVLAVLFSCAQPLEEWFSLPEGVGHGWCDHSLYVRVSHERAAARRVVGPDVVGAGLAVLFACVRRWFALPEGVGYGKGWCDQRLRLQPGRAVAFA